ncbi:MAG: UvrD-helicase domain-containing protein [Lachnospiraceae bacterium]|nr:UvrD-helicase domain-containing protein [Lachnospiraceae bacterium]
MSETLENLNDKQLEAATCVDGPLLIIAGAGSGKTKTLTQRIAYLIEEEDVNPYNIMAITFTNKAAAEMRERIDKIVGFGAESIWVMTFHSTCVRILRRYIDQIGYDNNFTIYDTDDSKSVMKAVFKKLQIDSKQLKEATVLREISRAKDELLGPEEYALANASDFGKRKFADAYKEYQETLRKNNALDFDDLIRMTVYLFKACPQVLESYQNRFRYIMVDEYQDTNTAQFELVRLLAAKYRNLCVVGDDDQSIYKFRGANIMNILNFETIYSEAKVIKLEQNYRSTKTILEAANAVIANNKGRKRKALWTVREEDDPIRFRRYENSREEATEIVSEIAKMQRHGICNYGDCAILYRTNAQSREFEERFVRENIPYRLVGGVNFYARKEIKDLLAYLKTIDNARDDLAVKRIINVPKRGIGAASITKVQEYADAKNINFFEACCEVPDIPGLGRAAEKIKNFALMIRVYRTRLEEYSIFEMMTEILEDTGYVEELRLNDEDDAEDRIENISEFLNKISAYEEEHPEADLSAFLEEVALVSDLDSMEEKEPGVILMTIHSAKGLEFPNVFLTGMEEGVFPSYMTINSGGDEDMEEERRLAYVAITRAKDQLFISCAKARMVRGETQYNPVSRFVKEIPENILKGEVPEVKVRLSEQYSPQSSARAFFKENPYGNKDSFVPKKVGGDLLQGLQKGSDLSGDDLGYEVGDRVLHIKFGEGEVLAIEKAPRDYKVTVKFDAAGQKIMYASFAKLRKKG